MLTRKTKLKAAKAVIEHPPLRSAAAAAAPPAAKLVLKRRRRRIRRRSREQAERISEAARTASTALANYGPAAAEALGLTEPPKQKKTAPRVGVGVLIGAGAMYLLEPEKGQARRQKVKGLIDSVK
jgi:hypothetical protein